MRSSTVLRVARAAHLQLLAVTVYEDVVRMPGRVADEHDGRTGRAGPFAPGSPARYHLPTVPVLVGATATAVVQGVRRGGDRAALGIAAACTASALGLTGYLVQRVVLRLLDDGPPLAPGERDDLVARWHRGNRARAVLLAAGTVALERAARRERT